jgi:uncharacterized membrane protein YphA (DoxX/SURF4 family)
MDRVRAWLAAPQPIERLALARILLPLVLLGFFSSRLIQADVFIGESGFHVPRLDGDWRQPLYLAPLPPALAWAVAALTVASGLMLAVGLFTRAAAAVFAFLLAYLALADRLEAFTVSKLGPTLVLALFFSPAGARFSIDAWRHRGKLPHPTHVAGGAVRFYQLFLPVMYSGSGIAKLRGDWLDKQVLFTHLHDSYQTAAACFLAQRLPSPVWSLLQWATLAFEVGAPLWFALPRTRTPALVAGLLMHAFIGLAFGPVVWFALLMAALLVCAYAPEPLLRRAFALRK